jgi:shikimate dehydrogenase
VLNGSTLVVNATTMGMFPDVQDTITDIEASFNEDQIVFDLIYNPTQTNFLQLAEKQGAKTISGMKMLISQAAKSFELWTGIEMPVGEISQRLEKFIPKNSTQ